MLIVVFRSTSTKWLTSVRDSYIKPISFTQGKFIVAKIKVFKQIAETSSQIANIVRQCNEKNYYQPKVTCTNFAFIDNPEKKRTRKWILSCVARTRMKQRAEKLMCWLSIVANIKSLTINSFTTMRKNKYYFF